MSDLTNEQREALSGLCDIEPSWCSVHHAAVNWAGRANADEVCCARVEAVVAPLLAEAHAAERETCRRKVVRATQTFLRQRAHVSYASTLTEFSQTVRAALTEARP